jgi:general secretion pathway protein G
MNRTNRKDTRYSILDTRGASRTSGERRAARHGFTIIEVMAVIVIIGILAGIVAINVVGRIDNARVTSTKANLKVLHNAVIQFKLDTGRYPTEEAGLQELIEQPTDVTGWNTGGYLETTSLPQDAWGQEFMYQLSPDSGKAFVIISYGADKEEGGEGINADLYSTDASQQRTENK